jgi:hypothetical protein
MKTIKQLVEKALETHKQEELANWMLKAAVNLPIDGESIFFADRPRWR